LVLLILLIAEYF